MFFMGVSLLVLHGGLVCSARKVQNAKSVYKGFRRKITLPKKRGFNALQWVSRFTQLTASAHRITARHNGLITNN
jgi:adenine-specific DNA methylase